MEREVITVGAVTYKNETISHDIAVNRRKSTGIHFHDEYELYYLLSGETKYFIGDEIFHLKKGNFILVPKGVLHKTDSEECMHNERILVSFGSDIFDEETYPVIRELSECKLIYVRDSKRYRIEELLHLLENEYNNGQAHKDIMIKLYILELLTLLCRFKCDFRPGVTEAERLIGKISEYISANFEQEISLKSLSRRFAVSESHLSRKFKAISGMGVKEYLTYVRIHNAERMLSQSNLSVTEVAARCGFNDSNYFASVFKRIKGVTPYRYSKRKR